MTDEYTILRETMMTNVYYKFHLIQKSYKTRKRERIMIIMQTLNAYNKFKQIK